MKILDTLYPVSKETTTTQKILGSTITHDVTFALFGLVTALGVALAAYYGLHVPNPYMAIPFGVTAGALTLLVAKILDTLVYQFRERQPLANTQSVITANVGRVALRLSDDSPPPAPSTQINKPSLQEREISYKDKDGVLFAVQPVEYQAGADVDILNTLYPYKDLPKPRILSSGRKEDAALVKQQTAILQIDKEAFAKIKVKEFLGYPTVVQNAVIERMNYYEKFDPASMGEPKRELEVSDIENLTLKELRSLDVDDKNHRYALRDLVLDCPRVAALLRTQQVLNGMPRAIHEDYSLLPIYLPGEIDSTKHKLASAEKKTIKRNFSLCAEAQEDVKAFFSTQKTDSGFLQVEKRYINAMMQILEKYMPNDDEIELEGGNK